MWDASRSFLWRGREDQFDSTGGRVGFRGKFLCVGGEYLPARFPENRFMVVWSTEEYMEEIIT